MIRRLRYRRDLLLLRLKYYKRLVKGEIAFWLMRKANRIDTEAVQRVCFEIAYQLPDEFDSYRWDQIRSTAYDEEAKTNV